LTIIVLNHVDMISIIMTLSYKRLVRKVNFSDK